MPFTPMPQGKRRCKEHVPDARMSTHMETETKRVKVTTEALLYDFLPAALSAATQDEAEELTWEKSQHVAGAVLVAACLLNVPPSFLEFLLCLPWQQLGDFASRSDLEIGDTPQVRLNSHDRRLLANLALHPKMLDCVLDFLYTPGSEDAYHFLDSLPLQFRCMSDLPQVNLEQANVKLTTRGAVAALLDGATPLHAAALRGNPAQIDHLLFCKADPMARTAAGDSPLDFVPTCDAQPSDMAKQAVPCQCLDRREAEVWQCRSKLARGLIIQRCLTSFSAGFKTWMFMAFLSLACLFGVYTPAAPLHRPSLQSHEAKRAHDRRAQLSELAASLGRRVSQETAQGKEQLAAAKEVFSAEKQPHGHTAVSVFARSGTCGWLDTATPPWSDSAQDVSHHICCGSKCVSSRGVQNADSAFDCFARALKALQDNIRTVQKFLDPALGPFTTDLPSNIVCEEQQAEVYCCWAETALLKYRGCLCTGCQAISTQAIQLSYFHTSRLFSITEKKRSRIQSTHKLVGARLARVLHAQICLFLQSHAQQSATRGALQHAQLSLQEWDRMIALGLAAAAELETSPDVAALHAWVQTAAANLQLVEAFWGSTLGPDEPLYTHLSSLFTFNGEGQAFVLRRVDKEVAHQLDAAVQAAKAASPQLLAVACHAAANAVAEVQSAAALQEIMAGRLEAGPLPTVQELNRAIIAAARFPNLAANVVFGQQLRDRWERRNETMQQLEKVMQDVCGPCNQISQEHELSQADYEEHLADWMLRIRELEQAIEQARETELSISMQKAKKILRELHTQAAAAEAAISLSAALQQQPCKPSDLREEVSKAEIVSSAAACTLLSDAPDCLTSLLRHAKDQLHIQTIRDNLHQATAAACTTADLPELDSTILAAREAGLDDLLPEPCRRASELRSTLTYIEETKATLQDALDSLQKHGQPQHAAAVESVIQAALAAGDLLENDVAHAKQALARWHASVVTKATLSQELKHGTSAHTLSKAIQEAHAVGLKVGDARKVLKLMQALEAALQQEEHVDALAMYYQLRAKVEAAEQGGVPDSCIAPARPRLLQLLMLEVKQSLDAALKPKVGQPMAVRASNIKNAVDRAESLINDAYPAGAAAFLASARPSHHSRYSEEVLTELSDGLSADAQVSLSAATARKALREAHNFLAMEAEEASRAEAQHVAEQRAKREQQRLERAHHEHMVRVRAERERAGLLEQERQRQADKERMEAELKQQMFMMEPSEVQPGHEEVASLPWDHGQARQHTDPPASPQLQSPVASHLQSTTPRVSPQPQPPCPQLQTPSPQLQQVSSHVQLFSSQLQQLGSHMQLSYPQLQQPGTQVQEPGSQQYISMLQSLPPSQSAIPLQEQQYLPMFSSAFGSRTPVHVAPLSSTTQMRQADDVGHVNEGSSASANHWLKAGHPTAGTVSPYMQLHQPQDQASWNGEFWRLDASRPSSYTYDGNDESVSERHSEAASSSVHRPAGRQATRSTSLRSSTASSDGVCSPGNTKRTGASSVHSYFTADPHAHGTERHAHPHKAEPVRLSHSLFSNHEYGLGLDAQRQTLSPGAGTERSGSSFSSSVTGRLTYADLGGAAWGAPAEAKTGTSLAPPVTLFPASTAAAAGPFNISTSATTGNDIGQLWAPEPPRPAAATQPHKQQRHKREVSLSDLGYLGFVARDEQNGSAGTHQGKAKSAHEQVVAEPAPASDAPRTLKVQRQCRFYSTGFCKWGNTCRFSHDNPNTPSRAAAPAASATGVIASTVARSCTTAGPSDKSQDRAGYALPQTPPTLSSSLGDSMNSLPTMAGKSPYEAFSPTFEFKTRQSSMSTMQPASTGSVGYPRLSFDSNIWNATDIANSRPFPGAGSGLARKFL